MTRALFIIDLLNDFRDGALPNPRMERIIPNIIELIGKMLAEEEDFKIFFLCDSHKADDAEFKLFPPHCIKGTAGAEIIAELRKYIKKDKSNVILKNKYSGFYDTELDALLKKEKPDDVILVGVLTDICVICNAEGFYYRGYNIRVAADCVETYDAPGIHDADEINRNALDYMKNNFGVHVVKSQKEL